MAIGCCRLCNELMLTDKARVETWLAVARYCQFKCEDSGSPNNAHYHAQQGLLMVDRVRCTLVFPHVRPSTSDTVTVAVCSVTPVCPPALCPFSHLLRAQAAAIDPDHAELSMVKGTLLLAMQKCRPAVKCFRAAYSKTHDFASYQGLVSCYLASNRVKEALQIARECQQRMPRNPRAVTVSPDGSRVDESQTVRAGHGLTVSFAVIHVLGVASRVCPDALL